MNSGIFQFHSHDRGKSHYIFTGIVEEYQCSFAPRVIAYPVASVGAKFPYCNGNCSVAYYGDTDGWRVKIPSENFLCGWHPRFYRGSHAKQNCQQRQNFGVHFNLTSDFI